MKYVLIVLFIAIVASLFQAVMHLSRDAGDRSRDRVVRALTVRIALSIVLFLVALVSAYFGLLEPQAVRP